jgi:hypothetical protein
MLIVHSTSTTKPSLIQHPKFHQTLPLPRPCPHRNPSDSHEALLETCLSPIDDRYTVLNASGPSHQRYTSKPTNARACMPTATAGTYLYYKTVHTLHMQSHAPVSATTPSSATQFRCCDCERDFKNEAALANHLRCSKVHEPGKGGNKNKKKQKEQEECKKQTKCEKCTKTFKNSGALRQHLKSVRHNPLSDIPCLADSKCKKHFSCPSGQLHHLESGRCVSGMTKTRLNAAIIANDTNQIITSGGSQWLLKDSSSTTSTSQTRSPILTPTSTEFLDSYPPSAILTPTSTLSASTNFHSILALQSRPRSGPQTCPLCPPSRTRKFNPSALQQHLSSIVHAQVSMSFPLLAPDEITFYCPRTLMGEGSKKKAVKQFSTVSGLAQHLESGACNGGKKTLKRMVEYVQEEMKGLGFGGLKLLS